MRYVSLVLLVPCLLAGAPPASAAGVATAIFSRGSGRCLTVLGDSVAAKAKLIQYDCYPQGNEQWNAVKDAAGYYQLQGAHSGLCVSFNGSTASAARAIQLACPDTAATQFTAKAVAGQADVYQLVNRKSGKCLAVEGASRANGAAIIQYDCYVQGNETWRLTLPASATPTPAPTSTPTPTPAPTPSPAPTAGGGVSGGGDSSVAKNGVVNARALRNGWGVNGQNDPARQARALSYLNTRWVRVQFDNGGQPIGFVRDLENALVSGGYADPQLKLQLLLNDYIQNVRNGVDSLPWSLQKQEILGDLLPIRGPTGKPVLAAIEGPNEINEEWDGGGSHPPDSIARVDNDFDQAQQSFLQWAKALSSFRDQNAAALADVELLSPTILYYTADNREWGSLPDVSPYVDYGTMHYYSGVRGTHAVPSWPSNPDNFARYFGFAQAAIAPDKPLVQSEGGASMETGGGYAQDGRSQARYMLLQLLDHFARGGHRFMIYELFDGNSGTSSNEDNFGLFKSDGVTPKPSAIALRNLANLLSLKNDWADPANLADSAPFTPRYTGQGFSVSGLTDAGDAGSHLILPKSDGSTMIAVWNEPAIDDGGGRSLTPAANPITVSFGSSQSYRVYDPTGGGGAADFAAKTDLTPIQTGTGASVKLTLYGTPLLIELLPQ